VAEQPRLDMLQRKRLLEQCIIEQIDLPYGQVVRRPPPGMDAPQIFGGGRHDRPFLCHERLWQHEAFHAVTASR
jgi:hypothetical protein